MGRKSKIEKLKVSNDLIQLYESDDSLSYQAMADEINQMNNLQGSNRLNKMNIKRFLDNYEYNETIQQIKQGDDSLSDEFKREMRNLISETNKIKELAKESPGDIGKILKAVSEQRRNLVALKKYAEDKIRKTEQHIYKYNMNVVETLRKLANEILCPVCRKRLLEEIEKLENK